MSSLIKDYEQQYAVLTAEITAQIGKLRLVVSGERRDIISKIVGSFEEAHELLEQMGLEIRECESSQRTTLQNRFSCYQAELKRLQQDFKNVQNVKNSNTSGGYESVDEFEDVGIQEEQKRRLLDNSERIERTGRQLEQGYRIVVETEQIGTQVLQDLSSQRDTIQRARSRLRETDADLSRSSRVMNSMIMRSIRERAIIYGIGLICLVIIIFSLYLSFKN